MNKDQVKGTMKEAVGKVQGKVGEIVGNPKQQVKGLAKEIAGKTQRSVGDAKEIIKDASKKP